MSKRTFELSREFFNVEEDNSQPTVASAVKSASQMLEVYGREVLECAAREAEIFGYHAAARRIRQAPLP